MQSRPCQILLIGLLLSAPSLLTHATAEEVGTTATVRNLPPEIVSFEVLLDARLGLFHYEVRAQDPNGAPDLDRAILHFLDREDRLWTHSDRDGTREGNTVVWAGVAHAGQGLTQGPFRVHLHVYDRYDGETDAEAPTTLLSSPLNDLRDPSELPPEERPRADTRRLVPLLQQATVTAAPQAGLVLLFSVLLAGTVLTAWRHTARPPQRRSGGRPGGR